MEEQPPRQTSLPRLIDVLKFSHQGLLLEDGLPLATFSRVSALLEASSAARVNVRLQFGMDDNRNRMVEGALSAKVPVLCQRCMTDMNVIIEQSFSWGFAWDDEKAKALPRHLDPVLLEPESGTVDLYDAIEDELLLALPMTFFHEVCGDGDSGSGKQFGEIEEPEEGQQNPFQALKDLTIDINKTRKS